MPIPASHASRPRSFGRRRPVFADVEPERRGPLDPLGPPVFPLFTTLLGAASLVAGWQAWRLRSLPLVTAVVGAWVAVAVLAVMAGGGPGLLIDRLVIVAALIRGRSAFG